MENMIDITGVDLKEFVKKVYELSAPQGLGFLHYKEGSLSNIECENIIEMGRDDRIALDMDYISGRACKMIVFKEEEKLWIRTAWYDHTDEQLKELLQHFNITTKEKREHGVSCNCFNCQKKRTVKA